MWRASVLCDVLAEVMMVANEWQQQSRMKQEQQQQMLRAMGQNGMMMRGQQNGMMTQNDLARKAMQNNNRNM